jgi:hypothetical protein
MPSPNIQGGAVLTNGDPTLADSDGQPDGAGTSASEARASELQQIFRPIMQSQQPELAFDYDMPHRSVEHVLTALPDESYLPRWIRGFQGFQFISKLSARFQELAQFRESAETGQPVAVEDATPQESNALFLQLALVAGPFGWQDENTEQCEQRGITICMPLDSMLELLEGATTHLAAINWGWEHALPRAAFLIFCIARILDDKRVSKVIDQLPPGDQELSLKLSQELVRNCLTLCTWQL